VYQDRVPEFERSHRRSDYRKAVDNIAGTFYKDMFHSHLKRGVKAK
jgi:hypothetical protein